MFCEMNHTDAPRYVGGLTRKVFSTGVADLDQLLGGGVSQQGIYMIRKDRYAGYGALFFDLFLSKGIAERDNVYLVSLNSDWKYIVMNSVGIGDGPVPVEASGTDDHPAMKIAWRYGKPKDSPRSPTGEGGVFDLRSRVPRDTLIGAGERLAGMDLDVIQSIPERERVAKILLSIQNALERWSDPGGKRSGCGQTRICVADLGGFSWPMWKDFLAGDCSSTTKFLWGLQSILRMYPFACACIAIPDHYYTEEEASALLNFGTTAIRVMSFLDTYPAYRSSYTSIYDGFIDIEQGRKRGWEALGFKVHTRGIAIKTLTIPPDDAEGASRVAPKHGSGPRELF